MFYAKNTANCVTLMIFNENRGKNDQNNEPFLVETFHEIFWPTLVERKRKSHSLKSFKIKVVSALV